MTTLAQNVPRDPETETKPQSQKTNISLPSITISSVDQNQNQTHTPLIGDDIPPPPPPTTTPSSTSISTLQTPEIPKEDSLSDFAELQRASENPDPENANRLTLSSFTDPNEPYPYLSFYFPTVDLDRPSMSELMASNPDLDDQLSKFQLSSLQPPKIKTRNDSSLEMYVKATDPYAEYNDNLPRILQMRESLRDNAIKERDQSVASFGTWDGVFVSNCLKIVGVIFYLRLPWVIGYAGVPLTLFMISISSLITFVTALSLSAIVSNGEIEAGGVYYIISRSLGPAVGYSLGVILSIGLSLSVALYFVGLAETVAVVLVDSQIISIDETENFIRVLGSLVLSISLLFLVSGGSRKIIQYQVWLLAYVTLTIFFIIISTMIPQTTSGYTGFTYLTIANSMSAQFTSEITPFKVFAVSFPMVAGILAGTNISGMLKNPSNDIPTGTIMSIGFTWLVYCLITLFLGFTIEREVLKTNILIQVHICFYPPLILAAIFTITFFSGTTSLISSPRIVMAMAEDNLFPNNFSSVFSQSFGREKEPIYGYFLSSFIAWIFILVGNLNYVALVVSNFFILAYALINISCFAASYSQSLAWRPDFKHYNMWAGLTVSVFSLFFMFATEVWLSVLTLLTAYFIFKFIELSAPDVEFTSWNISYYYLKALETLLGLRRIKFDRKWIPNFILFAQDHIERLDLVRFISQFSKEQGLVVVTHIEIYDIDIAIHKVDFVKFRENAKKIEEDFYKQGISAFFNSLASTSFRTGVQTSLQLTGIGELVTNTVVFGFKRDWYICSQQSTDDFVDVIRDSFHLQYGVVIARNISSINFYLPKGNNGYVDIWWLIEDGGLTLILPFLLSKQVYWKNTTLRIYALCSSIADPVYLGLLSLLKKFRLLPKCRVIPVSSARGPSQKSIDKYQKLNIFADIGNPPSPKTITLTHRFIRLGELLQRYSKDAEMIFITLPFPRREVNSRTYLSWLEVISNNAPPTIFLRGNGEPILHRVFL